MQIRKATKADIEPLAALATSTFIDTFQHAVTAENLAKDIAEYRSEAYFSKVIGSGKILLAIINGKIIGYIKFGEVTVPAANLRANDKEIHRLYIDKKHQNQKVGSKLLQAALASNYLKDAKSIYLSVWIKNTGAIKLYESFNFKIIGKYYLNIGEDYELIMQLPTSTYG